MMNNYFYSKDDTSRLILSLGHLGELKLPFWLDMSFLPHLVHLFLVFLDFGGNSVGCNLPVDLIQIAQYLKMFSIHS